MCVLRYICSTFDVYSVSRVCIVIFFFFKQKTAYEMRISDWSSDVCSSDLAACTAAQPAGEGGIAAAHHVGAVGPEHRRCQAIVCGGIHCTSLVQWPAITSMAGNARLLAVVVRAAVGGKQILQRTQGFADRKSTRLNSSH